MSPEDSEAWKRPNLEELVDYDPDDLYKLLEARHKDLDEAMGMMEKGLAMLQQSKRGDVPITLEDQFHFILRLFEDIEVLYLSSMVLIFQLKHGVWINGAIDDDKQNSNAGPG